MRPSLHPTLVNGRTGDPANFASGGVELLMFDTCEV
jgi:hypothetical protein